MKENHKDEYKLYLDWVRYKLNQAKKYKKVEINLSEERLVGNEEK